MPLRLKMHRRGEERRGEKKTKKEVGADPYKSKRRRRTCRTRRNLVDQTINNAAPRERERKRVQAKEEACLEKGKAGLQAKRHKKASLCTRPWDEMHNADVNLQTVLRMPAQRSASHICTQLFLPPLSSNRHLLIMC